MMFFTRYLPPDGASDNTGGTVSNRNFFRALASERSVTIVSMDSVNADPAAFASEPYTTRHYPAPRWRAWDLIRHWPGFVAQVFNQAVKQDGKPDLVVATTSGLEVFSVVPEGIPKAAIIRAYEEFGLHCPWVPLRQRFNLAKNAVVQRFSRTSLLRKADYILINSEFMKSAVSQRFTIPKDRLIVLPQLCDVTPRPKIAPPANSIGFVHRGPDKNVKLVLALAERAPDLRFFIYGHTHDLPSELPSNVEVKGWAADRDSMFASAALWLVPSLWAEPFGRVSMEAQAANRPVLVADKGGLPETVEDSRYKIAGYEPERWLERMRLLLQLPRKEVEENGARVRARFSRERHDAAVLAAFDRIMKGDAR